MSFVINAGELDKKIQIIRQEQIPTGGGYYETWEDVIRTCWAKFSRTSGTETIRANASFSDVKVRFLVRSGGPEIDTDMIVRYDGKDYDIVYINDYDDAGQYTEIICQRKSMEGT